MALFTKNDLARVDDLTNLIKDITNPASLRKIWQILKKKDIEPNYQALSQIDKIQIEINPGIHTESPEFLRYLEQRLQHDFSGSLTVSKEKENRYIFFCDFGLNSCTDTENNSENGWRFSIPTARVDAEVFLLDKLEKQIIYHQKLLDIKSQVRLLPTSEKELCYCVLRRLSATIIVNFTATLSQSFKKYISSKKAAELLLRISRTWENVPSGVSKGLYIQPSDNAGEKTPLVIYEYPKGKIMLESEIRDEWGLGFFIKNTVGVALINLGDSITNLLIDSLKDENVHVRQIAVEVLGNFKKRESVEGLIDILRNDHFLYMEALTSLVIIGDHRAYDYFIAALKSDSWPIRKTALFGLLRNGDNKAIESISNLLAIEKIKRVKRIARKVIKILKEGYPKKNKMRRVVERFLFGEDEVDRVIEIEKEYK